VRVDIGGVQLFFDVVGSALEPTDDEMLPKPTLLLLHGGPGFDHSTYRPYFDRFASTHQVVYFDQRGQGRSDDRRDSTGWDLDTWADDVVAFCDALGIEHPIVFGNSFGGMVAMRYGARHLDHPRALILSSTQARDQTALSAEFFERRGGPEARESYLRTFGGRRPSPEDYAEYARVCLPLYNTRPSPFGPKRTWRNERVITHFLPFEQQMDLRADLAAILRPTLVIAGADDPMCPLPGMEEIAALIPPEQLAGFEVIADCGHGSFRDQPEQTEGILRAFLARLHADDVARS